MQIILDFDIIDMKKFIGISSHVDIIRFAFQTFVVKEKEMVDRIIFRSKVVII